MVGKAFFLILLAPQFKGVAVVAVVPQVQVGEQVAQVVAVTVVPAVKEVHQAQH
jgi:hypothetical protein